MLSLKQLAPSVVLLTALTLASSISAFVVEILLAGIWGNSSTADAYRLTHLILVFGLYSFYAQILPLALVPWFTQRSMTAGASAAWESLVSFRRAVSLIGIFAVVGSVLLSGPIISMLGPGLDSIGRRDAHILLPCMMIAFVLVLRNGITAAALASNGIFWPGPVSQIAINVSIVVALSIFQPGSPLVVGLAVVFGSLIGASLHRAALLPASIRSPGRFGSLPIEIVGPMLPVFAAALATHVWSALLYRELTLVGTGAAATFGYAFRLTALVHTPAAMFCTVLLPSLSLAYQQGPDEMSRSFSKAVAVVAGLTIPLAVLVAALAHPLVDTLFSGNVWQGAALDQIARLLQIIAIGAPTGAFAMICQRFLGASLANHHSMLGAAVTMTVGILGIQWSQSPESLAAIWVIASWLGVLYLGAVCSFYRMGRNRSAPSTLYWVCQSPSPYNGHLFGSLAESSVPLCVYFWQRASAIHFWQYSPTGYDFRFYRTIVGIDWTLLWAVFSQRNSVFLTACWQDRTTQLILLLSIVLQRPYLIWNDTPVERRRSPWKSMVRSRFLSLIFSHARAVMGTGPGALQAFRQMGCPSDKLVNLPCFVNLSVPVRHSSVRNPVGTIIFGSCGRLHHDKGYDLALRALASLNQNGFDFHYLIAGAGPDQPRLGDLAIELNISSRVEFLGWVQPEQLPSFYSNLDYFLHPARVEPYGVSVLEAMASGCVTIASDSTYAALDRIIEGTNGFIHRCNDWKSLAAAIQRAQAADCPRVSAHARETAELWPVSRGVETIRSVFHSSTLHNLPPADCLESAG